MNLSIFSDFLLSFLVWSHSMTLTRYQSSGWVIGQSKKHLPEQNTIFIRDRHPLLRRDSNPQLQQANSRRPTLYTARTLGLAFGTLLVGLKVVLNIWIIICKHDLFNFTWIKVDVITCGYFWLQKNLVVELQIISGILYMLLTSTDFNFMTWKQESKSQKCW